MGVETALAIGIPLAIGAIGTMMQSGNRSDITQAGAAKLGSMQQAGDAYGKYRAEAGDARTQAMKQQMSMFQGANNMMNAMYGGGGGGPGGAGGTVDPGGGGWKPGDPGTTPGTPIIPAGGGVRTGGGLGDHFGMNDAEWAEYVRKQAEYAAQHPNGFPGNKGATPPILPPRDGWGASLMGPTPGGSDPMAAALAGPPKAAPPGMNPMLAGLARPKG